VWVCWNYPSNNPWCSS